ncbi:MAG: TolC family outer membrane protein [Litoreibacter sp.]
MRSKSRLRNMLLKSVATFSVLAVTAGGAYAHSLNQSLVDAYNHSNILEQNRALLRAADEDVASAVSGLRPQISAQAQVFHTDPTDGIGNDSLFQTIDLTASLLLYDFGRTRFGVEAAKETVLATRANLVNVEQQVLLTAVQAYVAVLRDSRVVRLGESNLRLIAEELRAAQDRFDVGEVTRTDVAQAEARLAEARGSLADSIGNLDISKAAFLAATGENHGVDLDNITTLPPLPASVEAARDLGVRSSPSVLQAQHQIRANEFTAAAAKAAQRPSLTGSATVGNSSTNNTNSTVGLTLNIPIYQGGQLTALHRRAIANVHASRAALNQSVLIVRQNVSNAWSQLSIARAQVVASERQIRAAQVAFDGVREEAKLGARTTLDVLDEEQALLDARTNGIVFQTQVYEAAYTLLSSMGRLTAEHLNLPVKRYDPSEYFNAVKSAPVPVTKQGKSLSRILKRYEK